MTTIDPANPLSAVYPSTNMAWFPGRARPYNNIQPFTYRDGETYLDVQTRLREWLMDSLVPFIDDTFKEYVDAFNTNIGLLTQYAVEFQTYIESQKEVFDSKSAEYAALVAKATTDFIALSTEAMTAVEADANRAEAARDLAEQYAATAGVKADNALAAFIADNTSATSAALRNSSAVKAKTTAMISITHKTSPTWGSYAVVEAKSGGFLPGGSLIGKRYAFDFDETNPTSTGNAFRPSPERLDSYAKRTGYNVASNASGWYIYDSAPRMMRGAQIRNGKIYHDFEATNLSGSPAGIEGLGLSADGHLRCYSALRGDTAASMVAAGVTDSWSYGPNLVVNGVGVDIDANSGWQYFAKGYRPDGPGTPIVNQVSARTIIGQRENGDVVIIATVGKTNVMGIVGNDMVTLAQSEKLYNASLFDGGGSTQVYAEGFYPIPSSDVNGVASAGSDGTFGRRGVGDAFLLKGILTTAPLDTGWRTIPLRTGFVDNGGAIPEVRSVNGVTELRGRVQLAAGNFPGDGSTAVFGDLPQQFGHETASKGFLAACNGENVRKVTVQSDRSLQVVGATNSPQYVVLDGIRWGTQSI